MKLSIGIPTVSAIALVGLCGFGFSSESIRQSSSQWMAVVEPIEQSNSAQMIRNHLNGFQKTSVLHSLPPLHTSLTPEEEAKSLIMRMEAQKALRDLKAKKMASHRRKGMKAWKREMEGFLTTQRQIKRDQVDAKILPQLKIEKEEKSTNPKWHPVRKGRSTYA